MRSVRCANGLTGPQRPDDQAIVPRNGENTIIVYAPDPRYSGVVFDLLRKTANRTSFRIDDCDFSPSRASDNT